MRIAVLTNDYPPISYGGAGRIAKIYSDILEKHGHDIRVWGAEDFFYSLHAHGFFSRFLFHIHDVFAHKKIVKEICEWKPDVLLTHNITGCGYGTPRAIQRMNIPWVHILHDVQLFEPSGKVYAHEYMPTIHRAWRDTWADIRRYAMGKPNGIVSPTSWLLEIHKKYRFFHSIPSKIIPNPISFPEYVCEKKDTRTLLYVGRLDTDKGLDIVYAAWPKLRDSVSSLILIGEGAWKKRFLDLYESNIFAMGTRDSSVVMRYMSQAGVVIIPSRIYENQPTVILEALQAGCHIIGSDVGGIQETLVGCGTVIPAGNIDVFVDACKKVLGTEMSTDERDTLKQVLETHNPEIVVSQLEDFIINLNIFTDPIVH